jgi:spore germination protein YaaH
MSYIYFGTVSQQISYVDKTKDSLDMVSPEYFYVYSDTGNLMTSGISQTFINELHSRGIKVVPFISTGWDRELGRKAMQNREALSSQIADCIAEYNLDGINVDIENLNQDDKNANTDFVRLLRAKIPASKEVSIAVASNPYNEQTGWCASYDYPALSQICDYLMFMTYDEHYNGGPAGPVASIGFMQRSVENAFKNNVSPDKIVLGIPFYGRIWSQSGNYNGDGCDLLKINTIINQFNASVTYDETQQSLKAEFEVHSDNDITVNGRKLSPDKYVIWFENERSIQAKCALVEKYNLRGTGSWSLGQEPASFWENYLTWVNGESDVTTPTPYQTPTPDVTPTAPSETDTSFITPIDTITPEPEPTEPDPEEPSEDFIFKDPVKPIEDEPEQKYYETSESDPTATTIATITPEPTTIITSEPITDPETQNTLPVVPTPSSIEEEETFAQPTQDSVLQDPHPLVPSKSELLATLLLVTTFLKKLFIS